MGCQTLIATHFLMGAERSGGGGFAGGSAIRIEAGAAPTIKNCIIKDNRVIGGPGGNGVDATDEFHAGRGELLIIRPIMEVGTLDNRSAFVPDQRHAVAFDLDDPVGGGQAIGDENGEQNR